MGLDIKKRTMNQNNQHKRYQRYLQFGEITWRATYGDECPPFVDEKNKEAWKKIEDTGCYKDYGMLRNNFVI